MSSLRDVLLLIALILEVQAAPHSGILSTNFDFLQDNLEFSRKITLEAEELKDYMCGFHSLCNEDELRIIQRQLGLRSTPLDRCQGVNFDREECFGQLSRGLKDFLILISSARPILHEKLDRLDVDVRDLLTNVQEETAAGLKVPEMMRRPWHFKASCLEMDSQAISVPYLPQETPQYQTHFQRKAGAFLIISDITDFMLMAQNAFRYPFGG